MTDEVIVSREGGVLRLRLNRPKAIHALNRVMCAAMGRALLDARDDPSLRLVMIDHAEGRGFCAGGDIRAIWESGRADGVEAAAFFHEEYRLNHLLFTYPRPVVAFMDGITMGGGVGISQPARFRVATERTVYAMPETGIGLFPDVGGGWYSSRPPGSDGAVSRRHRRADRRGGLHRAGSLHPLCPLEQLEVLKADLLADPDNAGAILDRAADTPPPSKIATHREAIARLFSSDCDEAVEAALKADGSDFAAETLAAARDQIAPRRSRCRSACWPRPPAARISPTRWRRNIASPCASAGGMISSRACAP